MGYFRSVLALQLRMGKRFMDTLARSRPAKRGASGAGKDQLVGTPPSRRHGPTLAAAMRARNSSGFLTRSRNSSPFAGLLERTDTFGVRRPRPYDLIHLARPKIQQRRTNRFS